MDSADKIFEPENILILNINFGKGIGNLLKGILML